MKPVADKSKKTTKTSKNAKPTEIAEAIATVEAAGTSALGAVTPPVAGVKRAAAAKPSGRPARGGAPAAAADSVAEATPRPLEGEANKPAQPSPADREAGIRHRAYLNYLRRGPNEGSAVDDWLQAEAEADRPLDA